MIKILESVLHPVILASPNYRVTANTPVIVDTGDIDSLC